MKRRTPIESGEDGDAQVPEGKRRNGPIDEFLLAEYDHISQAHFNTVVAISQFFQYYLIIASVPLSAAVVFGDVSEWFVDPVLRGKLANNSLAVALGLTCLSFVGICVMGYIISLRHDALLYARTVNGIRKHFFNGSGLTAEEEQRIRVLPRSTHLPQYFEPRFFLFVVLTFTLIDTLYASSGWWVWLKLGGGHQSWLWAVAAPSLLFHLALYHWLSGYRESHYLRSHTIGVDIDGVLGMHREKFCEVLAKLCDRPQIHPEKLDRIPVRECDGLNLTERDELAVFHEPEYWTGMEPYEKAADVLQRLHDILNYRILIFSWRPWPNWRTISGKERDQCMRSWVRALLAMEGKAARGLRGWVAGSICELRERQWPGYIINRMTELWLRRAGIVYDALTIEKGNVYSPYPRGRSKNRFVAARRSEMRVFVEDELYKAKRLAGICEVVFLIDHPYNQDDRLPNNVVRVRSWAEIYDFVRHNM